jgi:hypothetical protein
VRLGLDAVGDLQQQRGAILRSGLRPALKGTLGRGHRRIDLRDARRGTAAISAPLAASRTC